MSDFLQGPPPLSPSPMYAHGTHSSANAMCQLHTGVSATQRCACCHHHMCMTCDFDLGNGLHVCPTCAMASAAQSLGSRRKANLIWGYSLALFGTIALGLLLVGAFASLFSTPGSDMAAGMFLLLIVVLPAAIGFGVASSAIERHLPNSPAIWGAIIWNALIILSFIALTVIGLAS